MDSLLKEAEFGLLSCLVQCDDARDAARAHVKPEYFLSETHCLVFKAIMELADDIPTANMVTLELLHNLNGKPGMNAQTREMILAFDDELGTFDCYERYFVMMKRGWMSRKIVETMTECDPQSNPLEAAGKIIDTLTTLTAEEQTQGFTTFKDAISEAHETISKLARHEISTVGLSTGFKALDRQTGGLQPGNLIILAGRPSHGKSALAQNILTNVAMREGANLSVIFSIEMSNYELSLRALSSMARLDSIRAREGLLDYDDLNKLDKARDELVKLPIVMLDAGGVAVSDVRMRCKQLSRKQPLDLIVIDYLGLMSCKYMQGRSRENEIATTTRGLKQLARELNVPILLLSQLSRKNEERPDKKPILSDLRDSGAIEQDADVVLFVHRDEIYDKDNQALKGKALLIVGKQRNGKTGNIPMLFNGSETRFSDVQTYGYSDYNNPEPGY